jgi:hypothetical protein
MSLRYLTNDLQAAFNMMFVFAFAMRSCKYYAFLEYEFFR